MGYFKLILPAFFLVGCVTSMQQYENNYEGNSIYGTWEEVGAGVANELVIKEDGNFSFTAMPFEVYKDYWGTYTLNSKNHTINFKIEGGNNIPKDAKLTNVKYAFDKKGRLILTNFYYGTVSKYSKSRDIYLFKRF